MAKYITIFRKLGISLGLIVLVAGAGTLGFWYRDFLEPQISVSQPQTENAPQEIQIPQMTPSQHEIPTAPSPNALNRQEVLSEATKPQANSLEPLSTPQGIPIDSASRPTSISQEPEGKPGQPTITEPSFSNNANQGESLPPTQKQPDSIQPPATANQQPSKIPPASSKMAPHPITESPKIELKNQTPFQEPVALTPTNRATPLATTSTQSVPSPEDINEELTDEEIDELLRALDEPDDELSLLTVP